MCAAPTATNLVVCNHWQFTGNKIFHHRLDLRPLVVVVNIDAGLAKSHQWTHADPTDDEGVDIVACQQIHRDHASALHMTLVLDGGNFLDLTILNIHERKHITMTKMSCAGAFKASRLI